MSKLNKSTAIQQMSPFPKQHGLLHGSSDEVRTCATSCKLYVADFW